MAPKTKLQRLGPNQRKWLKALESGKFGQTKNMLHRVGGGYCCLGVAAEIFKSKTTRIGVDGIDGVPCVSYDNKSGTAPQYVETALALFAGDGDTNPDTTLDNSAYLTGLNDGGRKFKTIAALIRKEPSMYFREPR